jgi:regulator of protease activity HflC (stomatin/prohibitin superfamily)
MKHIKITKGNIGLLFSNGNFKRVLQPGKHWIWPKQQAFQYDVSKPFATPVNLQLLLQEADFKEAVTVLEVKDHEIVLQYEGKLLMNVLPPGRYTFWKEWQNYRFETINLNETEISQEFDKALLQRKELINYVRSYQVEPHERAVLYVNGKFTKVLEPGTHYYWKNPKVIHLIKVDTRVQQMQIAGQEMLTKDKAALRINFYLQYQVDAVLKAVVETKDYAEQLYVLMQLALREYIGSLSLDELLTKKEEVGQFVMEATAEKAVQMGVQLKTAGIRDIILPGEMKDIMNQVLVAEKKAQANTIMRREETASTRSLLNTAKLMEENAMLFKLKEMEYVEKIAEKISSISLSGGSQIAEQLKQLFGTTK